MNIETPEEADAFRHVEQMSNYQGPLYARHPDLVKDEPYIPRWRLERVAEDAGGTITYKTCVNSKEEWREVVIEYGRRVKEK